MLEIIQIFNWILFKPIRRLDWYIMILTPPAHIYLKYMPCESVCGFGLKSMSRPHFIILNNAELHSAPNDYKIWQMLALEIYLPLKSTHYNNSRMTNIFACAYLANQLAEQLFVFRARAFVKLVREKSDN